MTLNEFLLNYAPIIAFLSFIGMYSSQIITTLKSKDVSGIAPTFFIFLTVALLPKWVAQLVSFIDYGTWGLLLAETTNLVPAIIMMVLVFKYGGKDIDKERAFKNNPVVEINTSIRELKESDEITTGQISDTYYTFEELYYHQMILFSVICNNNKDLAWKSLRNRDGTNHEDCFIVGIETKLGDYTYQFKKEYWKHFELKELDYALEYDGHKPKDITRLLGIRHK